jgi:Domain of unknown function (DUF4349)
MSRIMDHRRLVIVAAAVLLVSAATAAGLALRGPGSSGSSSGSSATSGLPQPGSDTQGKTEPGLGGSTNSASGEAGVAHSVAGVATAAPAPQIASDVSPLDPQRFLVRTGEMSMTVAPGKVPEAAARIVGLTSGYGGYVLTSQVSTTDSTAAPFADLTVRVPASAYDAAIQRFGALGRVQGVQTNAADVTGQYVDLRARLAQARRVDQRLLGFLARTTTVTEALAVQARIDATELKVEQLAGEVKALHEQVSYGTLTVSVTERGAHHVTSHRHGFIAALAASWRHIVAGFEAIVVGLGAILPFAVLLAALAVAAWYAVRTAGRLRRHVRLEQ